MDNEDFKGLTQFVFRGAEELHNEKLQVLKDIERSLSDIACSLTLIYEHVAKDKD